MTTDLEKMLVEALEWYQKRAEALKKYTNPVSVHALEAVNVELMLDDGKRARDALIAHHAAKAQPQPMVSTDPTYIKDEISNKPEWELAFTLSEIMNDNAPIGWGKYVGPAKCLLDSYIIQRKQKAQPQKLGEFDELKKLKRKIADYLDNEDWDDEESLPDIFRECETVITALQARVRELKGLYENEKWERRTAEYPWPQKYDEARAKALEEAAQVLDRQCQSYNRDDLQESVLRDECEQGAAAIRALIQTGRGEG
jgi:hypothetical protein